jgi:radical SAM/Cys-rich protein
MDFYEKACDFLGSPMTASGLDHLQVNLGYRCNMSCSHCHVEGGAARTEEMSGRNIEAVLRALSDPRILTLDLTGGSPELHPSFRSVVSEALALRKHVIVRSNLTVLLEPGMEDLPDFLASGGVEITASLPCYTAENVDSVRGPGAFARSIEALNRLNAEGYGRVAGGLVLNLVYNPMGAFIAPEQGRLEADYRRELERRAGVLFTSLLAFTNMPLGRFRGLLDSSGEYSRYMKSLEDAFNPCALDWVMCRRLLSVGPDGRLFDCDFNQAAGLPLSEGLPRDIASFDYDALATRAIAVDEHCHGCTAGQGSSCMGAVA